MIRPMKSTAPELAAHLACEVTTLATCWKITRRDDHVLGFTDHVRDLEVDGVSTSREPLHAYRDPEHGRPRSRSSRRRERVLRRRDYGTGACAPT